MCEDHWKSNRWQGKSERCSSMTDGMIDGTTTMQRRWNCASLTLLLVSSCVWHGWANNDYGIGAEQSL
eukprot:7783783-Karenia_brevis.AAC.1